MKSNVFAELTKQETILCTKATNGKWYHLYQQESQCSASGTVDKDKDEEEEEEEEEEE